MKTFGGRKSVSKEDAKMKFKHQIALAKQNKISWEDLTMILDVLTPTFMSLKQLTETLLEELRLSLINQKTKPADSEDVAEEVIKVESDDDQDAEEMNEIESVSDGEEMPTDKSELKNVQLFTQSECSNEENDTANNETIADENELETETSEDDDQDMDEKVAKLSKEENCEMDALNVNAKVQMHSRPKMTYIQLIAEALLNAKDKALKLSDIYNAINERYPYYNLKHKGWQNSIRHNLSKQKGHYFILLDKSVIGIGGFWKLLPEGEEYLKKGAPIGDKRGKHDNHYKKI